MEEKTDKYQEPVDDKSIGSENNQLEEKIPETKEESLPSETPVTEVPKKEEVLSPPEKTEKPVKPVVEKVEPKAEVPAKTEKPIEAAKPANLAEDLSSIPAKDDSPPSSATDDKAPHRKKVEEIKKLSKEEQVKALCNLAIKKDVDFATGVAKGLDDAYVLDEFHDELDKLDLIKKGKLKEL